MSLIERVVAGAGRLAGRGSRAHPLGGALSDAFQRRGGVGDDWAPGAYADYLAVAPAVYACVNLRARNLARIPLRVHRVGAGGETGAPVGASHPAQRLFDGPNPFWSRQRFWYVVEASLCLWGSAPAAVFRDGRGGVRELWWLRPNRFRVVPDAAGYIAGYLYVKDGREIALGRDEVVWFRYPNPIEEYAGLSPIAALRMAVDMNVDAIRFNRRFFQNDASPGRVYLKADAELTSAQVDELRRRWEQSFAGREKSHAIAVLDKSADLKTMAISQREMEFIEAQRYTKEEICGAYGVPPVLVGDLRQSTFNNFQQAKASFWDETLIPELELIEAEINETLMPLFGEMGQGRLVARFDLSGVSSLREDAGARARRHLQLVQAGILTINEVRAKEGLEPVPWGDGPPAG